MIKFEVAGTAKTFESLRVWADVFNTHIDEVNDKIDGIGIWYNTLNINNKEGTAIRESFIWDEASEKIWRIYNTDGDMVYGKVETNDFCLYCLKQWKRLCNKNGILANPTWKA